MSILKHATIMQRAGGGYQGTDKCLLWCPMWSFFHPKIPTLESSLIFVFNCKLMKEMSPKMFTNKAQRDKTRALFLHCGASWFNDFL